MYINTRRHTHLHLKLCRFIKARAQPEPRVRVRVREARGGRLPRGAQYSLCFPPSCVMKFQMIRSRLCGGDKSAPSCALRPGRGRELANER